MAGTFNPKDSAATTNVRPAHVNGGAGERRWWDDDLNPRPYSQDFNILIAQLYALGDAYGQLDTEGNDNYLRDSVKTVVDNAEWTVDGVTGTADISGKAGLKGVVTNAAAAGITSFGTVVANKVALVYSATTGNPIRITPSSTLQTPNNMPLLLPTGGSILVVGASDASLYRVYHLSFARQNFGFPLAANGDFENWPENTSFSPSASTVTQLAYGWKGRRSTNTNWTVSRQTGFNGARYCMRVQRTAGDTAVNPLVVGYQVPSHIAQAMANKTCYITFDLRCGATMVTALGAGATLTTEWRAGIGWDESPSLVNGVFGSPLAGAFASTFQPSYVPSTTGIRVALNSFTVGDTTTEGILRVIFTPIATAAGASEYYEITNFKIELGEVATPFVPEPAGLVKSRIAGRYRKSFLKDTAVAQNVGVGTGELRAACTKAGANSQFFAHVEFEQEMEGTPSITLYNPAAANGQVRNVTGSTDSTAAAAANITTKGFDITMTGNAAWAVGDILAIHYSADARL